MKKYETLHAVYLAIQKGEISNGDTIEIETPVDRNIMAFKGKYFVNIHDEKGINLVMMPDLKEIDVKVGFDVEIKQSDLDLKNEK